MTNAEKFEQIFGIKPDENCCPLACDDDNGGLNCFGCDKRNFFKEIYDESKTM